MNAILFTNDFNFTLKQAQYYKIYMFKSKSRKFCLSTNPKFSTKIKFLSRWIPAWLVVSVETQCNYEVSFYLVVKIPKQYLYFYLNNKFKSVISRKCQDFNYLLSLYFLNLFYYYYYYYYIHTPNLKTKVYHTCTAFRT